MSRAASIGLVALLGCAAHEEPSRAVTRTDVSSVAPVSRAPASIAAAASLASVRAPASSTPTAPEPERVFGASPFATDDHASVPLFPDRAAFCAAALREAGAQGRTSCRVLPLKVPFTGDSVFHAVIAVRVIGADVAYSTLLVKLDRGLAPLPVTWDDEKANDPGCPSIVERIGLERITIENGVLVVVTLGVNQVYVEVPDAGPSDTGFRSRLGRQLTIAKVTEGALHTRAYGTSPGPDLGWKEQPDSHHPVPWERLPWRDADDVKVLADGTLHVVATR